MLQPWEPQQRSLYLLSCGQRRAIASWDRWSAQGRWVWLWKDHIDRAFIAKYGPPAPTPEPAAALPAERRDPTP
jgi:hypothetical protein